MSPLLQLDRLSKSFGGVRALGDVSLELRAGEIHGLIGENGAGKSTLIKIITGAITADSGTMRVRGEPVTHNDPLDAKARGIAVIYQQPALFPELTVAENMALGLEPPGFWRRVRWGQRHERARDFLRQLGADIDPGREVRSLSMPEQQLVEIARALGANAQVLILDEPTASLSHHEADELFRVLERLRSQGVGIIYVSHRLEELELLADRVTVLRDGTHIATRDMRDVDRAELIRLMVGRELSTVFPKQQVPIGEVVLSLRGVGSRAGGVMGVDLDVRAGEIVGLAGLVGAGRTELARVLFGLTPGDSGTIMLRGQPVQIDSPQAAIILGIAYVPEDRRQHGVILDMSVTANTSLAQLKSFSGWTGLDAAREDQLAATTIERLAIKTTSAAAPVGQLSGGNQQKVALGRWLATQPQVLILDEPTQGIDVGAKAEIHRLMGDLARQGVAILMISSELPEILGMSDRIAVMHRGSIVATLDRNEATPEAVLAIALGDVSTETASR